MSKNYLLPTNIIVSLDPCPLSPIFWCFRAGFCDLLLSKPCELPTVAFFQSRNSGESVPCRDKWSKRTRRILAEYYLRIQYIRPLGSGTTLLLHLSTSLDLRFHRLFSQPSATNRVRGVAGILSRMASRQTATITLVLALATSCSICAIALSPRSNRNES